MRTIDLLREAVLAGRISPSLVSGTESEIVDRAQSFVVDGTRIVPDSVIEADKKRLSGLVDKPPLVCLQGGYRPVAEKPFQKTRDLLVITVATGPEHEDLLTVSGPLMKSYADRIGADFVALTGVTQSWWGLEKFRIRPYVEAYDRTLFLDADIIVRDRSPNIFAIVPRYHIGMHDDATMWDLSWSVVDRRELCESQGVPPWYPPTMRNTGVVVCDRLHADIWTPMAKPFPGRHCDEQFWIERWTRYYYNFHLPPEFNTQWYWKDFDQRAKSAWFVHLANYPAGDRKRKMLEFLKDGNLREVDRQ